MKLYRPVGTKELELVIRSGNKAFPPRLPEQPIFYPVLNEEYARGNNMRKAYRGISLLILFLMVAVSGCGRNVSNSGAEISADLSTESMIRMKNSWYETRYYPIYYGNPEWGKHSMDEVFDANNPPLDLLFSMSSEELAALLFESPYLTQMLAYYGEDGHIDYSTMFWFLELHSDIFYELLRREDGVTAILVQYQNSGIDEQWLD